MDNQKNNDFQPKVKEIDPPQELQSMKVWKTSKTDSHTIKMDLDTLLEIWFFQILIVGGIIIALFLSTSYKYGSISPIGSIGLIVFIAIFLILYFGTDNYYLIDLKKKQVLYNFSFLFHQNQSVKMSLDRLTGIAVGCKLLSKGDNDFSGYAIFLIDNKGKSVRMTNWNDLPIENANLFANWLGKNLNCPVFPGESEKTFNVDNIGGIKVEYKKVQIDYMKILQYFPNRRSRRGNRFIPDPP